MNALLYLAVFFATNLLAPRMSFGHDSNAYTDFRQTVYTFHAPTSVVCQIQWMAIFISAFMCVCVCMSMYLRISTHEYVCASFDVCFFV